MSDKVKPQHLERKAVVYVRQSLAYRVTASLGADRLSEGSC